VNNETPLPDKNNWTHNTENDHIDLFIRDSEKLGHFYQQLYAEIKNFIHGSVFVYRNEVKV
jgi:hypothetical protein